MKKREVYICWHEGDNGEIDSYDFVLVPENMDDIANPDNIITTFPVLRTASGSPVVSTGLLDKIAVLINQGYDVRTFF